MTLPTQLSESKIVLILIARWSGGWFSFHGVVRISYFSKVALYHCLFSIHSEILLTKKDRSPTLEYLQPRPHICPNVRTVYLVTARTEICHSTSLLKPNPNVWVVWQPPYPVHTWGGYGEAQQG